MMDDIAEQQDLAKEIGEAISNPVAFGTLFTQSIIVLRIENKFRGCWCLKVKTWTKMNWNVN